MEKLTTNIATAFYSKQLTVPSGMTAAAKENPTKDKVGGDVVDVAPPPPAIGKTRATESMFILFGGISCVVVVAFLVFAVAVREKRLTSSTKEGEEWLESDGQGDKGSLATTPVMASAGSL
jgi:hypothetical protein